MNILLAETTRFDGKNAGNKARADVQSILESLGFVHINLYKQGDGKIHIVFSTLFALICTMLKLRRGDYIVLEHPYTYHYEKLLGKFVFFISKIKKVKTILIIHDINSIRFRKIAVKDEINIFNYYDYIICHNNVMELFLKENGCHVKIFVLGLFDYLINENEMVNIDYPSNEIVIAGNLTKTKCGYIYEVPKDFELKINLYGVGLDEKSLPKCMDYKGAFSPEELPSTLQGRFGLVWDGYSIKCGKDIVGEYLRYNNPHKASLYIVSGLPLIVWKESAIASYVLQNSLGIVIDSLLDLPDALQKITEIKYKEFKENVLKLRLKLIEGEHLKKILRLIMK